MLGAASAESAELWASRGRLPGTQAPGFLGGPRRHQASPASRVERAGHVPGLFPLGGLFDPLRRLPEMFGRKLREGLP